jgi:hypothetical protein
MLARRLIGSILLVGSLSKALKRPSGMSSLFDLPDVHVHIHPPAAPSLPHASRTPRAVKRAQAPQASASGSLFDEELHPRAEMEHINPETGKTIKPGQFAPKPNSEQSRTLPDAGFRGIAQRMINADDNFVETVQGIIECSREDAFKVLEYYRKHNLVKHDFVSGRYSVKHGALMGKDALERARVLSTSPAKDTHPKDRARERPEDGSPEPQAKTERPFTHNAKESDIPFDRVVDAHRWNAMDPEGRARMYIREYMGVMDGDWATLAKLANTPEKRATLVSEFERYRQGYLDKFLAMMDARSRTASVMVTGGSNFPTRSNEKRLDTEQKRTQEFLDHREHAMKSMRRDLTPEVQPIKTADAQAIPKIESKLEKLEKLQALMTVANQVIRKHKGQPSAIPDLVALGISEKNAEGLLQKDFAGRIGFADYQLKNNGASIRRLRAREEDISVIENPDRGA